MTTVLGLDIGGSKTHAARSENGVVVAEALAGSANVTSVGPAEAGRQLDIILEQLGNKDIQSVCAGAAGVDSPAGAARLRELLASRLPGARIRVVHDSELILAAAGVEDGIALIAGTGSVAWGRRAGRHARAGGWGYALGDEGSGYWVAREAVRRTLRRVDTGSQADRLGRQLVAECELRCPDELLDHFYAHPERRYWAGRARMVFELAEAGDRASSEIVEAAATALADLAVAVSEKLDLPGPTVLAGGLAVHQPLLQNAVRNHLDRRGLDDVRVLDIDPVRGAVTLARSEPNLGDLR
ncbi:N-acetylglucosamine kinase [Antrihabitans sp. YC2-6]|uniref:N-acetylglucosamine kinase n=1 Tax=Antrihabitans sp. YC2-6 TaxID=2799498 RepID=UPI0018F7CD89|nr:BadF/BadG/BcrA/BcrD ATPase family protein [Antrihabitans sp. YC2-6]MBJ8347571.1 ATPase [Antrihabitans sp. YC2-6]